MKTRVKKEIALLVDLDERKESFRTASTLSPIHKLKTKKMRDICGEWRSDKKKKKKKRKEK